ncbi:hypothetical protein ABT095_15755 [Kitasatospora sp. NPDC002227]|uniref:hypothetical protein n=1 Tax=Kitasatospora sp. NPDC002227 TaxID=3154773 RepID=UPI003324D03F
MSFCTADGSTVEVRRYGCRIELHLRAADGRTVATVDMDYLDAEELIDALYMAIN